MKQLIMNKDYEGIRKALAENPSLANEGIPYDEENPTKAHPLHRICDGVFTHAYTDQEAVEMARIFLEFGAHVDGDGLAEKQDTPLTAAASLHAEASGLQAGSGDRSCIKNLQRRSIRPSGREAENLQIIA